MDLDPQACLTFSLGLEPDDVDPTIHDVLVGRVRPSQAVVEVPDDDFRLLPANIDLAGVEAYLLTRTGREYALRQILERARRLRRACCSTARRRSAS